ncbi:uncharacterized protein M421DRAFT_217426 [Didymella exigua CBS 183.55]|uniref:Apple domain-containing protein n=1 Tax=Didymella exigua CBS 183.55 TaxID=1150837 RepID=A0A6A5RDX8_9PLEO|nr:uncharacterized protein M421DRAFT_217426 [Didymella exigua CBS 183.55]KAF1926481.1 hypothetical protein M421DRAFT_217426 [Didymella exigua CBS 183.55]
MYAELITAALAVAPTTLFPRQVGSTCPTTIACPTNNGCTSTAANGAVFELKCSTNYNGPVIEINQAASFAECLTACSLTSGCKGLNYKGKFCYLLGNKLGGSQSVTNVQAAIETKTATKTSPAAGSSTCAAGPTCPSGDGCVYAANKKNFYTRCSFDFYGGDMAKGVSEQKDLKACVDKCSTTTSCVAVSYGSGTCYLKSTLNPAIYRANVNGAYIK